jgi:hypothetical protein
MTSLQRLDRPTRIAVVTTGLTAAGAAAGASCAAVSIAIIALVEGGSAAIMSRSIVPILAIGSAFGGLVGALVAPLLGWGLLRRVALGRMLIVTFAGTTLGALVGELVDRLAPLPRFLPGVFAGALLGFLGAGVALRLQSAKQRESLTERDEWRAASCFWVRQVH